MNVRYLRAPFRSARRGAVLLSCAAWALSLGPAHVPACASAAEGEAGRPAHASAPRKQPCVRFEPNVGQTEGNVAFIARGGSTVTWVTPTELVTRVRKIAMTPATAFASKLRDGSRGAVQDATVRMRFEGADPTGSFETGKRLDGVSNYFIGDDSSRWRVNVPAFDSVRRRSLYRGTDLVLYSAPGVLEYDLVLAPGADPNEVAFTIEGADGVDIDPSGGLVLRTACGPLRHEPPLVYQEVSGQRRLVPARYTTGANGRVGFAIGAYDASAPLVIDPVLSFSTYLGGSGEDIAQDVTLDAAGNIYVTGYSSSTDFPTRGAVQPLLASPNTDDAVVTKFDPSGAALVFSTYLGGNSSDFGNAIRLDAAGAVYVTGTTYSDNFPVLHPFQTDRDGFESADAFVTKLDASGAALVYSTYLSGNDFDYGVGLAVDGQGQAFVTGETASSNYPVLHPNQTFQGLEDAFVTKLAASGSSLVYSTLYGGVNTDHGSAIAIDAAGNAYITGFTFSAETFPVVNAFQPEQGSLFDFDGFVAKFGPAGNSLLYSSFIGGSFRELGISIAIDSAGDAFVTGLTQSEDFPTHNPIQASNHGSYDVFAIKVAPSGSTVLYSTYLGGNDDDFGNRIAVDSAGNAVVVGLTLSTDYPTVNPLQTDQGDQDYDGFVSKIAPSGSALVYSTYFGGDSGDNILAVALDTSGAAYVVGETFSDDFPVKDQMQGDPGDFDLDEVIARIADGVPPGSVGAYLPATGAWFLRNTNTSGPADVTFTFGGGNGALIPITGDWDGNGTSTPGVYDPTTGAFFLRNSNAPGPADVSFTFGPPGAGWIPVAGDWDRDGADSIGLYDRISGTFFLTDSNAPGPANRTFSFGPAGAELTPLAGDWNGDGVVTVGLYNPAAGSFFLKNANVDGPADMTFVYGPPGAVAAVGDWDGDGRASVGVFVPSTRGWFLRDSNSSGLADSTFVYGPAGATPVAGNWDGR